ncbi:uncharacterized protein PGTG_18056 [Puccinia graminis f. sp. tritici CRL 75-36-700-3]|uniref:Uncharacterized protein n=1 Tax=Puccinia graminis f. sp. tritici (strain CRL 75-36-700-3 / race SCCL) TaxID=418459 RepID=E3L5N7_PUCGT|nr:uncharacterized protein PGTG_18056 [Puccinia graminis f. sp. tritici CRL 75-36-700-3]EFP91862.1 hypothetical protein PGTG_18056 [Puccinia graminis f. sp. tritici CRL 75-36-700-3]
MPSVTLCTRHLGCLQCTGCRPDISESRHRVPTPAGIHQKLGITSHERLWCIHLRPVSQHFPSDFDRPSSSTAAGSKDKTSKIAPRLSVKAEITAMREATNQQAALKLSAKSTGAGEENGSDQMANLMGYLGGLKSRK